MNTCHYCNQMYPTSLKAHVLETCKPLLSECCGAVRHEEQGDHCVACENGSGFEHEGSE